MKELLNENRVYLTNKQIENLSSILPKEQAFKYIRLIRMISKVPNITSTFVVDELTWHIICSEAAKRKISSKEIIKEITHNEACRLNKDFKAIYPLIRALKA